MAEGVPSSPMARKFMIAAEKGRSLASYGSHPKRYFEEVYYFFYGTLMDPPTLGRVLNRSDTPNVHKATIEAYKIKLWGEYPALVIGFPEQTIHGIACKIRSQEEADRLAAYETAMYGASGCGIRLEDGSIVSGWTFVWNADESLLEEGTFDLQDWLSKTQQFANDQRGYFSEEKSKPQKQ